MISAKTHAHALPTPSYSNDSVAHKGPHKYNAFVCETLVRRRYPPTKNPVHTMLTYALYAIVILTTIWTAVDSHRLQISSSKKPYSFNSGSFSWLLGCILLWIIVFPVYLFKRARTLKERGTQSSNSTLISLLGTGAVAATLLCIAGLFLGWQRLSVDELRDQVSTSIQSTWGSNPATQSIRLKSLSLIHRNGNEYSGLLVADVSGKEEQHSVDVTYDGKNLMWKIQP